MALIGFGILNHTAKTAKKKMLAHLAAELDSLMDREEAACHTHDLA